MSVLFLYSEIYEHTSSVATKLDTGITLSTYTWKVNAVKGVDHAITMPSCCEEHTLETTGTTHACQQPKVHRKSEKEMKHEEVKETQKGEEKEKRKKNRYLVLVMKQTKQKNEKIMRRSVYISLDALTRRSMRFSKLNCSTTMTVPKYRTISLGKPSAR